MTSNFPSLEPPAGNPPAPLRGGDGNLPVRTWGFEECRGLWLAGRCPCCGSHLVDWEWNGEVYHPEAVAEDVMFCGQCIGNNHHTDPPEVLPLLLEALLP